MESEVSGENFCLMMCLSKEGTKLPKIQFEEPEIEE